MNLFEYIKSQLPSMPNASIMKDMGASDELIEYIRETPWNTNLGMMETYGSGSSADGEVWFTGTLGDYHDGYKIGSLENTDKADVTDLIEHPETYIVSANGILLQIAEASSEGVNFTDTGSQENFNLTFTLMSGENEFAILCPTDITTVEITVKAK